MINLCALKKMAKEAFLVVTGIATIVLVIFGAGKAVLTVWGPDGHFYASSVADCFTEGVFVLIVFGFMLTVVGFLCTLAWAGIKDWYQSSVESCEPKRRNK